MGASSVLVTLATSVLLAVLPRRYAALPLLLGATYVAGDAVLELGPAHFTVLRILVAVGFLRVLIRGERPSNGTSSVDRRLMLWSAVLLGSSVAHTSQAWVFRMGMIWGGVGSYFLFRCFLQDWEDVRRVFKILCLLLVPVAMLMLLEKFLEQNFFTALGQTGAVILRDGHVRARGPFVHPILAGTVGATCLPMALYLWKSHRKYAALGLLATTGIIFASTSSGPVMMALFTLVGLALWKARGSLRAIRWLAVMALIALSMVMKDPVYFLMARIDITGGSTGWFRARLIQSSIEHLDEWWLAGTDYTRHWMATGIYANAAQTDITNHLLAMGVMGGLPLMCLFIVVLAAAFRIVGRALRENEGASQEQQFLIWTLGAILFGQVANFFSISLFDDQSVMFFYLVLAAIGAVQGVEPAQRSAAVPSALCESRPLSVRAQRLPGYSR